MSGRSRPVRRGRVLLGALLATALLAGVVGIAEELRHPHPGNGPIVLERAGDPEADPRTAVECAEPEPAEDTERGAPESAPGAPVPVTSNELYACPQAWDGSRVRYEGEVVGGVLPRGEWSWVQVNDDVYADVRGPLPAHRDYRGGNAGIGVAVPASAAEAITTLGGPQTHGDLIEVVGRFERVDEASREVAIIRATDVSIVRAGTPFEDVRLADRELAAAVAGLVALAMVALERRRAWRARHGR